MLSSYNVKLQQNVSVQNNTDTNYSIAFHFLSGLSSLFLLDSNHLFDYRTTYKQQGNLMWYLFCKSSAARLSLIAILHIRLRLNVIKNNIIEILKASQIEEPA